MLNVMIGVITVRTNAEVLRAATRSLSSLAMLIYRRMVLGIIRLDRSPAILRLIKRSTWKTGKQALSRKGVQAT
jgi:hypothetical protein